MPGDPCLSKYIDADGYLTSAPVYQTPSQWGTVYVGDLEIIPENVDPELSYEVWTAFGGIVISISNAGAVREIDFRDYFGFPTISSVIS